MIRTAPGRPSTLPVSVVPGGAGTPIPETPVGLAETGAEAWQRLWTVGRRWLSNEAHWDLMVQVCETLDRRDALVRESRKRTTKMTVRGSMGQDRVNPLFEAIDKADAKVRDLLIILRFQPSEQKQKAQPARSAMEILREHRRSSG